MNNITTLSESSLLFWGLLLALGVLTAADAWRKRRAKRRYR